ncbi:uncharacterized protein LOC117169777 [Belonocnema kinseyi]|uniref:uncharacterized protein LOC117169777 n=1 Tax=Belonocnema kinseyi TaxID=2817044 RepID=UPI00143D1600|nr:uncharacterized protein LOC117169777 [Belonocnema kinseyi]
MAADESYKNLGILEPKDGCKSEDNSKVTVWPIYITLYELPPRLRKEHVILAGLWVAKNDPPMNIFLKLLVDQADRLSTNGFKWMRNGVEITSKLFPLGCCVDSVARCAMLNMKKFNGHDGCTFCEHPAVPVDGRYSNDDARDIEKNAQNISSSDDQLQFMTPNFLP